MAAMFRHLRTKLTVLYAGLFAAILLLIAVVALTAVSANARQTVRRELVASSVVFERVWALRTAQLENDGVLLSRDFGFRTAVATRDAPTIRSALDNLKARLGIDKAMMISPDDGASSPPARRRKPLDGPSLQCAAGRRRGTSGVLTLGGAPYEAVSVPIGGGVTTAAGWCFAEKLDRPQMAALEIHGRHPAERLGRLPGGALALARQCRATGSDAAAGPRTRQLLRRRLSPKAIDASDASTASGRAGHGGGAAAAGRWIPDRPIVLLLRYPMAQAMAPYHLLLGLLLAAGALGSACW